MFKRLRRHGPRHCYSLTLVAALLSAAAHSTTFTPQQQQYLDARAALAKGDTGRYLVLRQGLEGYPLTPYLDFHAKLEDMLKLPAEQALGQLKRFQGTPLYATARYRYLLAAGQGKRWQDFLKISPTTPRDVALQCYFYRANLAQQPETAYQGAQQLWLYGRSRPKACDPLFHAWEKAGYRTQALVWSRMLLAFNSGQYSLLRYLASKVNNQTQAKQLLAVYKDPQRLRHTQKFMTSAPINADIVDAGLRRLAKQDLQQSVKLYVTYQQAGRFSEHQGRKLSHYLVRRALITQDLELQPFVDNLLPLIDSDDLKELRLRWAIRDKDQQNIDHYLPHLSRAKQAKSRWQFWAAKRALSQDETVANTLLSTLSQERNFYGFSAAYLLNTQVQLQHQATVFDATLATTLANDPGLARVTELLALDKTIDARAEWVLLLGRHDKPLQAQYALLAEQNQWDDLAVQATIQGKLWNDMTLRFPFAANRAFETASQQAKVDIDDLRAIARRESAFYPYATSGVGARGLMQLMPATAKETANKSGLKYLGRKSLYDVHFNTQLGSRYYASLLERFDNNRVLATAAYNAGPHRVTRWLDESNGQLDVIAFIESIPFRETREYVQAVLSYRVIYQVKQNKPVDLFSAQEWQFKY